MISFFWPNTDKGKQAKKAEQVEQPPKPDGDEGIGTIDQSIKSNIESGYSLL